MTLVLMHHWLSSNFAHSPDSCFISFFTLFISHYLDIFRETNLGLLKCFAPVDCGVMLRIWRNSLWEEPKNAVGCLVIKTALTVNYTMKKKCNFAQYMKQSITLKGARWFVRLFQIYCLNAWNGQHGSTFLC